jgi:hypothetical protein
MSEECHVVRTEIEKECRTSTNTLWRREVQTQVCVDDKSGTETTRLICGDWADTGSPCNGMPIGPPPA